MISFRKLWALLIMSRPKKERRIKQYSKEWFDGEIADEIKNRDKLFKKLKISTMQQDINYKK